MIWICGLIKQLKITTNYNWFIKIFGHPIFQTRNFESDKFDVWTLGMQPRKIEILTKVDGLITIKLKIVYF